LKHVENWNKYILKKKCASSWLFTRIEHVSAFKSHFQDEYKGVYITECHKMEEMSFIYSFKLLKEYY